MSAEDWIVGGVLGPLLILGVWVVVVRVWRAGLDVSLAVSAFSRGGAGYHAFLGPAAVAMTLLWLGAALTKVDETLSSPPSWMDPLIGVLFAVGATAMALGGLLWVLARPRFLVPPQFRDPSADGDGPYRGRHAAPTPPS